MARIMGTHPRWRRCRTRRHQTGNEYSLPPARLLGARAKCVWVSLAPLSLSSRRKAFVTAALIFAHCDFVLLALGADSGDFVPITELGSLLDQPLSSRINFAVLRHELWPRTKQQSVMNERNQFRRGGIVTRKSQTHSNDVFITTANC
jgi:hypothetical protein